jgi:glycosyltransferase involved in cell wall biosynthesis
MSLPPQGQNASRSTVVRNCAPRRSAGVFLEVYYAVRLLFLTSGRRTPSTRFRMLAFVGPLRSAGHACTVAHSFPEKYNYFPWLGFRASQRLKRLVRYIHLWMARMVRYDAVVIERELFDDGTWETEAKFRRAVPVFVLDIDDAVFLKFPAKFDRLREMADLVIAGNKMLEQWATAAGCRVAVIPTCIDTDAYQPNKVAKPEPYRPVIGWMGTSGNMVYLPVIADALCRLACTHEFEFRVISDRSAALHSLDLKNVHVQFKPWSAATELADLQRFDIGVMPLIDEPWSRYKCGAKLLQYMSCGIPGVASPVGVNCEIITQGVNGFLASTSGQWEAILGSLLEDAALRIRIGDQGRRTVEQSYSIAGNVGRWIAAVQSIVDRTA